jgi:hypothetical protein
MRFTSLVVSLVGVLLLSSSSVGAVTNTPNHKLKNGTSTNWSGYVAQTSLNKPQNDSVTDVKGQWVMPSVYCPSTSMSVVYSSAWVGIDGYSNGTVEQIGTETDCNYASLVHYAWYELYPKYPVRILLAVNPGDTVNAEVRYMANNQYVMTINNLTTGQSYSTTQKASAKRQSAEWVVEAPSSAGSVLPLANFGTVSFTNATATLNGVTGAISNGTWQHDAITMTSSTGVVKAIPSALDSTGQAFSDTWQHQ